MLREVFDFWIIIFSKTINWLFTLEINDVPKITFGEFILACAFIGIVIYFILGTDFIPGGITIKDVKGTYNKYQAKQATVNSNKTEKSK